MEREKNSTTESGASKKTSKKENKRTKKSCWSQNAECPNNVNTIKLLNNIKNNATMAKRATETVIENVDNKKFADILKEQVIKYDDFVRRADKLARGTGTLLEEKGGLSQFFTKTNIKMKLMTDNSISKIAELMIIGNTMGVIDLGKTMRHTPDVNPDTMNLARELLMYEEDAIEAMKFHL